MTLQDCNRHLTSVENSKVPVSADFVRARGERTFQQFSVADNGKTKIVVEVLTDPEGALPDWAVNSIQSDYQSIANLVNRASKGDIPHDKNAADGSKIPGVKCTPQLFSSSIVDRTSKLENLSCLKHLPFWLTTLRCTSRTTLENVTDLLVVSSTHYCLSCIGFADWFNIHPSFSVHTLVAKRLVREFCNKCLLISIRMKHHHY